MQIIQFAVQTHFKPIKPYEVLDNGKYLEGGRGAPQVMIIQLNSNQLHVHFGS